MPSLILYKIINKTTGKLIYSCNPDIVEQMKDKGYIINASIKKYKYGGF